MKGESKTEELTRDLTIIKQYSIHRKVLLSTRRRSIKS